MMCSLNAGDKSPKRQQARAMRRHQKNNFPFARVEKFLSSFRQSLGVVTPFVELLEQTT